MDRIKCSHCNALTESHLIVNCCVCKKPYKTSCVNLSNAEARKIHSKTGLFWMCTDCADLGSDLDSLKSVVASLRDEIKTLKSTIDSRSNTDSLLEMEKIIQEVGERDRRKCNIVIHGRDEAGSSAREQSDMDSKFVKDLFTQLSVDEVEIKPVRLGKFDVTKSNRRRPIRVTLSSKSAASAVLNNFRKLRSSPSLDGLSIFPDRTQMQMEMHRNAKVELSNRLKNGESNLRIKYNKGIPSIVSSLN